MCLRAGRATRECERCCGRAGHDLAVAAQSLQRHGLGAPTPTPQPCASAPSPPPTSAAASRLPLALIRCLWRSTTMSSRSGRGPVGSWPSGCGAPRTTRRSAPGWWWSCTARATRPSPAPGRGRSPAVPTAPTAAPRDRDQRGDHRHADRSNRALPHQPTPPIRGEGDGCRCPMTEPGSMRPAARRGSAPTCSPTSTVCRSTSWPAFSGSCPAAARSRSSLACCWRR
jgi:hypothetical protein